MPRLGYKKKPYSRRIKSTHGGRKPGTSIAPKNTVSMWHVASSMPYKLRNRMKFSSVIAFTTVAGAYGEYVFRMNSLYDPDQTGVGSQPTGFDQWATFYNLYRVVECNCKIRYLPQVPAAGATASTGSLVLYPSINATGVTTYVDAVASDRSKTLTYGYYTGGESSKVIKSKMPIATIAGATLKDVLAEDDYAGATTGNPANLYYWIIGNYNTSTNNSDIEVLVELEYWVEWSQRKMLDES